jgi:hypothetical protein
LGKHHDHDSNVIYDETVKAIDTEEGCRLEGVFKINKVPGNFHLSTHAFGDVIQRLYMTGKRLDFTHTVHNLTFGEHSQMEIMQSKFGEKFEWDMEGVYIDQS